MATGEIRHVARSTAWCHVVWPESPAGTFRDITATPLGPAMPLATTSGESRPVADPAHAATGTAEEPAPCADSTTTVPARAVGTEQHEPYARLVRHEQVHVAVAVEVASYAASVILVGGLTYGFAAPDHHLLASAAAFVGALLVAALGTASSAALGVFLAGRWSWPARSIADELGSD